MEDFSALLASETGKLFLTCFLLSLLLHAMLLFSLYKLPYGNSYSKSTSTSTHSTGISRTSRGGSGSSSMGVRLSTYSVTQSFPVRRIPPGFRKSNPTRSSPTKRRPSET